MMKILAVIMVMANIIFFLWEYRAGALQSSDKKLQGSTASQLQSIRLVSEVRRELEDKVIGQSEAVKERFPFVSDFFRVQVVAGNLDANPYYQFLPQDKPVSILGVLNTADEATKIKAEPISAKSTQMADTGGISTSVEAGAGPELSSAARSEPPSRSTVEATQHKPVDYSHATTSGEPVKSAEIASCYEAGPFKDLTYFEQWRKQTGIAPKLITPVRHEEREVTGYLVYYPAPVDFEQALANVAMLKRKGITDYWLFRKGDSKGEISLGLFRNKTRAEVLERQLSAKGLDVLIKPRYKNSSQLYARISITLEDQEKLMTGQDRWRKQHPGFTIEAGSDCAMTPDVSQE